MRLYVIVRQVKVFVVDVSITHFPDNGVLNTKIITRESEKYVKYRKHYRIDNIEELLPFVFYYNGYLSASAARFVKMWCLLARNKLNTPSGADLDNR